MLENPVPAAQMAASAHPATGSPSIPLRVDAQVILGGGSAFQQFREQVGNVLSRNLRLSISIAGLDGGPQAGDCLRRVCAGLEACTAPYTPTRELELVIGAGALQPDRAWEIRAGMLGRGPLYLLASERNIRTYLRDRARFRMCWQALLQLQSERCVRLACAPLVRSCCPLLTHEVGSVVLPRVAVQAPSHSAWLTRTIDLCRFADSNGVLDRARLRAELHACIDASLAAHRCTEWPTASLRHDSWLNRRLAICVSGIGDLVVRRRQDPRDLACLASLRDALRFIQTALSQRSRHIALSGDAVPAIGRLESPHAAGMDQGRWAAHWNAALHEHATACRYALVLSPWSVFPRLSQPDPAFLNLLPILYFADACAFPEPPVVQDWNVKDFIQLYQRTWATLERRAGVQLFAERV